MKINKILVSDGAWGTELFKMGLEPGECADEWNLSHPDEIMRVAKSYYDAGSDIILTNTFGANRFQLESHGITFNIKELNKKGASLTREACNGKAIIAGDIGPSGKLYAMEDVSQDELFDAFSQQALALCEGGVQWIVVETMTDAGEMEIAVRAAAATKLPVVACMTYQFNNNEYRTIMGHTPKRSVEAAVNAGASIIGANCGGGIDTYIELASQLRKLTTLPIWIKANAGLPQYVNGRIEYRMSSDSYASFIRPLLEAGVNIVGGCCGTNPEYIMKIRKIVDDWNIIDEY